MATEKMDTHTDDVDGVPAEESGGVQYNQEGWADFLDDDDLELRYSKLNQLKIVLSRNLKYRDLTNYYKERTVSVSPIIYDDMTSGVLSEFFQRSLCFCSSFNVDSSSGGRPEYDGTLFLHFKKKDHVEEEMELLRNIRQGLRVCLVKNQDSAEPHEVTEANIAIKQEATEENKSTQKKLEKTVRWTGNYSAVATNATGLPMFKEDTSLFSTTISESVTEDQLWELFPSARFIIFYTEPFRRLYVMFNSEEAMQSSVEALKTMDPSLPAFQLTRLSSAGKAFQKFLPPKGKQNRLKVQKKGKGVETPAEAGKQGTKQQPNTVVVSVNASPAQQGDQPPTPQSGKKRKKAGAKAPTQDKPSAMEQGSNENPDPVTQSGSGSSANADQPEVKLSKGQLKRLKRRMRLAQEGSSTEPPAPVQQPQQPQQSVAKKPKHQSPKQQQQQQQQQPPPQPDVSAGLALLQTLTSLAQNMSTGQMNPFQMPAQPQQQSKRKNRNQNRNQGQGQQQQQQYIPQADNFSTVNQGRFDGSFWKQPQDGPLGGASKRKKNRSQNSSSANSFSSSTQDYMSFEDSSLNNSSTTPQMMYGDNSGSNMGFGGQGMTGVSQNTSAQNYMYGRQNYSY